MKRLSLGAAAAAGLVLAAPAVASAQLGSVGGLLPGVGQVVDGTTKTLDDTLDKVLGGSTAALPPDVLGDVLGAPAPSSPSPSGTPAPPRITSAPGSVADTRAPMASVRVLSRLKDVGRTGRLRVEVRSDEAGVVAFTTMVRPGAKRRGVAKKLRHDRSVIHIAPVVVAFNRAGAVPVSLRLTKSAQRRLNRSRNGRMSVGLLTADAARNQAAERLKRHLAR